MDTQELEQLLEAATETQTKDFKGPCCWDVKKFAKDILALSNVKDGGYIIVGVAETPNAFERKGISEEQEKTFNPDIMRDQMESYAEPHVNFTIDIPLDKEGRKIAVITVFPFEEIPVICNRTSGDCTKGVVYYRNKGRRVESAAVSNAYDMRDIIKLATLRMMQRKVELGFTVEPSAKKKLDEELGDL